ncbi:MAG: YHS domain-containing (seleno)protein [Opitutales bacterium]
MKLSFLHRPATWRWALCALVSTIAFASTASAFRPVATSGKERLALGGHDVVAYHTVGKAVTGHVLYRMEWEGAVWQFQSRENLIAFRETPKKFAPVFGGYCTVTVAKRKATYVCSGKHFLVHQGKLYIAGSSAALKEMRKDPQAYIARAQPTWDSWVEDYEQAQRDAADETPAESPSAAGSANDGEAKT